jgi:hypothetical protein
MPRDYRPTDSGPQEQSDKDPAGQRPPPVPAAAGHAVVEGHEEAVHAGVKSGRDTDPRLGQPPREREDPAKDRARPDTPSGFTSAEVNQKSGGDPRRRG